MKNKKLYGIEVEYTPQAKTLGELGLPPFKFGGEVKYNPDDLVCEGGFEIEFRNDEQEPSDGT